MSRTCQRERYEGIWQHLMTGLWDAVCCFPAHWRQETDVVLGDIIIRMYRINVKCIALMSNVSH